MIDAILFFAFLFGIVWTLLVLHYIGKVANNTKRLVELAEENRHPLGELIEGTVGETQ